MNKILFFVFFVLAVSCNDDSGKNLKGAMNQSIDDASGEIIAENLKSKQELLVLYQNLLKSVSDTLEKAKAQSLMEEFIKTDNLIDSIQTIIKKLDRNDVNNVNNVKSLLADGSLGDSLKNYLSGAFDKAKEYSISHEQKNTIESARNNLFKTTDSIQRWQGELFGLTDPLGASLILFGLQKELYNVGRIAFKQ